VRGAPHRPGLRERGGGRKESPDRTQTESRESLSQTQTREHTNTRNTAQRAVRYFTDLPLQYSEKRLVLSSAERNTVFCYNVNDVTVACGESRRWTASHFTDIQIGTRPMISPLSTPYALWLALDSTCSSVLLLPLVHSLLSLSHRVLTSPYRVLELDSSPGSLVCGTPGGSRAMPSPYQGFKGPLHAQSPKPGTPGDFSPAHVTDPLCAEF
jgi:hypothetical protein